MKCTCNAATRRLEMALHAFTNLCGYPNTQIHTDKPRFFSHSKNVDNWLRLTVADHETKYLRNPSCWTSDGRGNCGALRGYRFAL